MREPTLSRSVVFLNSLLVFVCILFMIDAIYARSVFLHHLWLAFIISVPVKLYASSGIFGYLVQLASGEEMVLSFSRFHDNAKRYLLTYTVVLAALYAIHFILFAVIPSVRTMGSFQYFYPFVGIFVMFLLARIIVSDRYLKPANLPRRAIKVSGGGFAVIVGLFLAECVLSWVPAFLSVGTFDWTRLTTFALKYIYLLQFVYFTFLILETYPDVSRKFKEAKEVFLINPCSGGVVNGIAFLFQFSYPPVFVVLKALTPKSYSFREFNRIFWRDRYYRPNKLVAITCFTSNCAEAYKIAKEFKRRGSKVIMGGPHVTYLPDEALAYCDSVVVGEAEGVWKEVIRDFEAGTLQQKYMGSAKDDYYTEVHKELLASPPYVIKDFLETTRGCKFRCHFCTIPSLSGGRTRKKPVGEIVELIQKIKHKYNSFTFIDNNIYSDPAYAKELFQALIPLKVKWRTQCTIDIAKNTETLKLAKKSGCAGFLFGYEIFGGSLEKQQGGKFAMAENYIRYTDIIKKAGIKIKAHFIFGFDTDSFLNLHKLWKFCISIWPRWTILSMLTPLPGSRLYHDMLQEKRIINLNWRNYAMHDLVVTHPYMNGRTASFFFPFIRTFFLMTTSSGGLILLGLVASVFLFEAFMKWSGVILF